MHIHFGASTLLVERQEGYRVKSRPTSVDKNLLLGA